MWNDRNVKRLMGNVTLAVERKSDDRAKQCSCSAAMHGVNEPKGVPRTEYGWRFRVEPYPPQRAKIIVGG
jgi:hypothetical protein